MSLLKKLLMKITRVDALGDYENPYMRRYFIVKIKRFGSIRVHEILQSDNDRHLHDHPFHFFSLILKNGYTEVTEKGTFVRKPHSILFRRAQDLHRIIISNDTAWTIVVTSRWIRRWGFKTEVGWIDARNYEKLLSCNSSWISQKISDNGISKINKI